MKGRDAPAFARSRYGSDDYNRWGGNGVCWRRWPGRSPDRSGWSGLPELVPAIEASVTTDIPMAIVPDFLEVLPMVDTTQIVSIRVMPNAPEFAGTDLIRRIPGPGLQRTQCGVDQGTRRDRHNAPHLWRRSPPSTCRARLRVRYRRRGSGAGMKSGNETASAAITPPKASARAGRNSMAATRVSMSESDIDLLARARSGEAAVWERIVGKFGPVIRGYARAAGLRPRRPHQDVFSCGLVAAPRVSG